MTKKYQKDKSSGQIERVPCGGACGGSTNHEIVSSYSSSERYYGENFYDSYQIIKCLGCDHVSFRSESGSDSDIVQVGEDEYEFQGVTSIYPPRNSLVKNLGDEINKLPTVIGNLYKETSTALLNSSPVLVGIGLRGIVETICKEKNAKGDNLKLKIDNLVSLGILTKQDSDVLHDIRTMGNDAAHEAKPHSEEQLRIALEVVEHLLKSVYIIPFKLSKFKKLDLCLK